MEVYCSCYKRFLAGTSMAEYLHARLLFYLPLASTTVCLGKIRKRLAPPVNNDLSAHLQTLEELYW